jgi:hypothetical protein
MLPEDWLFHLVGVHAVLAHSDDHDSRFDFDDDDNDSRQTSESFPVAFLGNEQRTTAPTTVQGFPKPEARHELFVACHHQTGQVVGMAEVDAHRREDDDTTRAGATIRGLSSTLQHAVEPWSRLLSSKARQIASRDT